MTDLSGPGVRALVIGTATHTGPTLPPVQAAARSAEAVRDALVEYCGVPPGQVRLLIDPPRARDMAEAVAAAAGAAESVLLIYFVGHGLLDANAELHLAARETDTLTPGMSAHQALAYPAVREALAGCAAAAVVLILDCCYSGRARPGAAHGVGPGFTPPPVHGAYVLASAENLAAAPEGAELTTFTGAFVALLRDGDPRAGRQLTLDVAYDRLLSRLRNAGGPLPRRQSGDTSGALVLAANRAALPAGDGEPDEPPAEGISPYLGLASFGEQDSDVYFGREPLVRDLLTRAARALAAGSPLIVVGPSGAGKSSLVRAGLLAALHRGTDVAGLEGSPRWPVVELTTAVAWKEEPEERAVVVVDQLEQLFTLGGPDKFLAGLARLAERHLVVLALRADFYAPAAERPELRTALDEHQFLVTPMSEDELRAAVEGPAAHAGLRLEGGLADVILLELGTAGGAPLPLLSHTLWATWRHRSGDRLTMAGYRAAGGVARAVATSAEEVWNGLGADSRAALRRMLPRLVRVGEDNPDTVRPAPRDELLALADPDAGMRALEAFTAARLITQDRDDVRLSHEALLRVWPRLVAWLDEDRDWLRTGQRIAADASAWSAAGRDPGRTHRGTQLAAALEAAGPRADVPPESTAFLDASRGLERRATRLRRAVVAALVVLLVLTGAGAAVAVASQHDEAVQRQAAQKSRNRALARALYAEVNRLRDNQPGLAKQLALVAYRLAPEEGSKAALATTGVPGQYNSEEKVFDLAQGGDGRVLAMATGQALVLWDATAGVELSRIPDLFTGPVAVSPDGRFLAAAIGPASSADPTTAGILALTLPRPDVRLWDIADPRHPRQVGALTKVDTSVTTLAYSPDGRLLAGAGAGGRIHVWDTTDPAAPRSLPALTGHRGRVDSLTFAPARRLLASSGADGTTRLWDLTDPAHPAARGQVKGSPGRLNSDIATIQHRVAFNRSGRLLALVEPDGNIEVPAVYDVTDPLHPRPAFQQPTDDYCLHINALLVRDTALIMSCDTGEVRTLTPGVSNDPATRGQSLLRLAATMPTKNIRSGAVLKRPPVDGVESVAVASTSGVFVWDVTDPRGGGTAATLDDGPNGFSLRLRPSPAGPPLLTETSGRDGTRILDVSDPRHPRQVGSIPTEGTDDGWYGQEAGAGVAFRPDGAVLAATRIVKLRPHVVLLSTAKPGGPPLAEITDLDYGAAALSFSADGTLLAVADHERVPRDPPESVKIFDVSDPAHPRRVASFPALTWDLTFSPVGRLLAVFTEKEIVLRDLTDPAHPRTLPSWRSPSQAGLAAGVFTPDGRRLIVGDQTTFIRIFQVGDDGLAVPPTQVVARATGNSNLAISPDGHRIAVPGAYDSNQVDLWDITDPGPPRLVTSVTVTDTPALGAIGFSPDGRQLAVLESGRLALWWLDAAEVKETLCRLRGDPISASQWRLYLGDELKYDPPC